MNYWWIVLVCLMCTPRYTETAEPMEDRHDDYVNPLDMLNFDSVNMRMREKTGPKQPNADTESDSVWHNEESVPHCKPSDDSCDKLKVMHETATKLMRQYSLSLVRLMEPQLSSANKPIPLDLRMMVTYHGLKKLKQFGEGIDSDFHVWHETLVSLAQYAVPAPEESRMARFYWLEDKLGLSLPMMLIMMVLVLASFLIVLMISKLHVTKQVFLRCIFVIFVISIVLTMVEMYQGKVAEQEELFMTSFKEHCPKAEDMTVWERIYSFVTSPVTFEDDKCKKYFKAMLVSPLVSVSPLEAVAVALVKTVVTPMDLIGQGIKNFLVGLLKDLPFQLQTFVLICLFFLLILMPLLMMGYSFNFLYLINISPQREVRETQYARADLASSENSIESQSNLKSLNQASPSGIVKPQPLGSKGAFKKNAIAEGSVSMPHIQIPTINYGPPEGTAHVQALASALESPSRKMGPVLEQPDGGDVKREVANMGIRARPGAFSNPSQASGDIDTSEASNNSELCQKLAQVTIGQKEASKIDEDNDLDKGCDCNVRQGRDVKSVSQLSSDLSGGLSNSDVAVELQKLRLNEGKNSSDVLQSLDTRNDNVVEQENQKPK